MPCFPSFPVAGTGLCKVPHGSRRVASRKSFRLTVGREPWVRGPCTRVRLETESQKRLWDVYITPHVLPSKPVLCLHHLRGQSTLSAGIRAGPSLTPPSRVRKPPLALPLRQIKRKSLERFKNTF